MGLQNFFCLFFFFGGSQKDITMHLFPEDMTLLLTVCSVLYNNDENISGVFCTCAVDVICSADHLLKNLSSHIPHIFTDLDSTGLSHEQVFIN